MQLPIGPDATQPLGRCATLLPMKDTDIEAKIDDLARMVVAGFSEIRGDMATKADLEDLATKADLADMATKADLAHLRGDIDIMLDKHIGIFRKDFDELAARVKRLEQLVLK